MITAIIPTYQRPDQLKDAIESVLNQTYKNFRILVLDNASNDNTKSVVSSYIHQDNRISYHCHQRNIGMLGNYSYAFNNINTPFFHILSDDDLLSPYFLEIAINALERHPNAAYCSCSIDAIDEKGSYLGNSLESWPREGLYPPPEAALEMSRSHGRFPMPTGVLFRTKLAIEVPPYLTDEMLLMWDPDYLLRLAARFPIVIQKKTCGKFLAHSKSFSSQFYKKLHETSEEFETFIIPCKLMIQHVEQDSNIPITSKNGININMMKYIISISKALVIKYIRNKSFDDVYNLNSILKKHIKPDWYFNQLVRLSYWCHNSSLLYAFIKYVLKGLVPVYRVVKKISKNIHST